MPPASSQSTAQSCGPEFTEDGLHLPTIRAVLKLLQVNSDDRGFYFNESNNYGHVKLSWWSGPGDPFKQFAGEALMSEYRTREGGVETRPNGAYLLNEAAVQKIAQQISEQRKGCEPSA